MVEGQGGWGLRFRALGFEGFAQTAFRVHVRLGFEPVVFLVGLRFSQILAPNTAPLTLKI